MSFSVGFVSGDGITISAHGETLGAALHLMCTEFGNGFTDYYQDAHKELTQVMLNPALAEGSDVTSTPTFQPVEPGVPAAPVEDGATTAPTSSSGGDTNSSPTVGLPTDTTDTTDTTQPGAKCSICRADITNDRAVVSRMTYGDDRCKSCSG